MKFFLFTGVLSALLLGTSASAQIEESLRLRYGTGTELQLGVGVNEADPSKARQFCLNFAPDDIFFDVGGATTSELSTRGVFDIRDFVNDFKFDYSIDTTASAGVGKLFNAKSTVKNTGKFELYLKNFKSNYSISIDASAHHGSERIRFNKGLKPEFQALLDSGDFATFREKCGTHFVSSRTLVSQLSVMINATDVSRTLKNTINQTWNANFSAKGTIEAITAEAKVNTSTSLSNALTLTDKFGNISHEVKSRGGAGISSVAQVLANITFKPEEIAQVYSAIAIAAKDFTRETAAPDEFNLISYEIFGAEAPNLDPNTFSNLERIYKRVVRIDAAVDVYEGYKVDRPTLYSKYFKPIHDSLLLLRQNAVGTYKSCRSGGDCDLKEMPELRKVVFLEDILKRAKFETRCSNGHSIKDAQGKSGTYFSSADMVVSGELQYLSELDLESIRIMRNITADEFVDVQFDPGSRLRVFSEKNDTARFLMQMDSIQLPLSEITTANGFPDTGKMSSLRLGFREIAYVVEFAFKNGITIEEIFALPDLTRCKVKS